MVYHVATKQDRSLSQSAPYAKRTSRAASVRQEFSKGTFHAVEDASATTVCGLSIATLDDFPDVPWPPVRGDRCLMCRQWAPVDDDD
jgi:hypothetical protein